MIKVDMEIEDVVRKYPEAVGVLTKKGIRLIQCGEPAWGTLGEFLSRKRVKDVDGLVEELNRELGF